MREGKRKRSFVIFNLVTTSAEEIILVVVLMAILPRLGVNIPIWLVLLLVLAWAVWSYITYRLGARAIDKIPVVGAEALIGIMCRTTTPLSPIGYVKVGGELWLAHSIAGDIDSEVEVVIVELRGLTLLVTIASDIATHPRLPSSEFKENGHGKL
jgi:membrane-bound ClpP family serine protease